MIALAESQPTCAILHYITYDTYDTKCHTLHYITVGGSGRGEERTHFEFLSFEFYQMPYFTLHMIHMTIAYQMSCVKLHMMYVQTCNTLHHI